MPQLRSTALTIVGGGLAAMTIAGLARRSARTASARQRRGRHRVVVVGAGFGGLDAAARLVGQDDVDLTVIDAHNHHLFQPLLYQVATAALSPADIASPVREIIPPSDRSRVLMATVTGVDTASRRVLCHGQAVPYDDLIIATGSESSYFGHDDWARDAPSLKTLDDALALRRHILGAFERASGADDDERARLLTFVLIGAGPTGVEMAGSIAELAHDMLVHDYGLTPEQARSRARILLVEAGPRVLSSFPADLSDEAAAQLVSLGVELRTGTPVTGIEHGAVHLGQETIAANTVIWTAGTKATPVAEWLGVKPGHGGRVPVGGDLQVPGRPGVFVIGDAALALDKDGHPLPNLAPVAKQQGVYVARAILRRQQGRPAPAPFRYRDYGTLATIGRNKAVAEFGPVHLSGLLAWVMWAVAHIFFLIGFRNRVMVSAEWAFAYVTHRRGSRLIVGRDAQDRLRWAQPPVAKPG